MSKRIQDSLQRISSEATISDQIKKDLSVFNEPQAEYLVKEELYSDLDKRKDVKIENISLHQTRFENLWKRIKTSEKSSGKSIWINTFYRVAAILIIALLIGNLFGYFNQEKKEPVLFTTVAPKGSVSQFLLPDSTVIYLNSGSTVSYVANNSVIREVDLKGEAWFKVKKSKEIPFIVHTPIYDVRVMGTEFNVKAYKDDKEVVTTLEEGSIRIESGDKYKLEEKIQLKPGEQLVFNKGNKTLTISEVKASIYSSWRDNKLMFINTSFDQLVLMLERRYGVEINIQDQSIANYHYDGTIKNETLIEVLDLIKSTLPIDYAINNNEINIIKRQ